MKRLIAALILLISSTALARSRAHEVTLSLLVSLDKIRPWSTDKYELAISGTVELMVVRGCLDTEYSAPASYCGSSSGVCYSYRITPKASGDIELVEHVETPTSIEDRISVVGKWSRVKLDAKWAVYFVDIKDRKAACFLTVDKKNVLTVSPR